MFLVPCATFARSINNLSCAVHRSPNGFPPQSPALPSLPQGKASVAQLAPMSTGSAKWAWRVTTTGSNTQLVANRSLPHRLPFRKTVLRCSLRGFSYGCPWNWAPITMVVTSSITFFIGFPSFLVSPSFWLHLLPREPPVTKSLSQAMLLGEHKLRYPVHVRWSLPDQSSSGGQKHGCPEPHQGMRVGCRKQLSGFPLKNGQRCSIH